MTHYLAGKWIRSAGPLLRSTNPANDQLLWEGNEAETDTIDAAVAAANQAFTQWSRTPFKERAAHVEAFANTLTSAKEELAIAIAKETGKTLWDSRSEVIAMINKAPISIEAYTQRCPTWDKTIAQGTLHTLHRPHGVMAVLGPYNFPGHLPNGHIIPALLAGNTVVFKPSELTPKVGEQVMRCWEKSGIPPGVINMIQGGKKAGQTLSEHPKIDGLLFTGSWATGLHLSKLYAKTPNKILALEMGGNNPLVIGTIDQIEATAYLIIQSAYLSSGQRCTCARRLIVPRSTQGDALIETLIEMTRTIVLGAYEDQPEPFMGPMINAAAAEKMLDAQEALKAIGGRPLLPMQQLNRGKTFLSPGLIDTTHIAHRPDEEYFGPLLQIIRIDTLDEAIQEANRTAYGLAAGLISTSQKEFDTFFTSIRAGVINWNTPLTGASSQAPFGGIGHSGNNRPSALYAADYCSYPIASLINEQITAPKNVLPGVNYGH